MERKKILLKHQFGFRISIKQQNKYIQNKFQMLQNEHYGINQSGYVEYTRIILFRNLKKNVK